MGKSGGNPSPRKESALSVMIALAMPSVADTIIGEKTFNHFDLYRFQSQEEWLSAGFNDYINDHDITIIEWPEKAEDILSNPDIEIEKGSYTDGGQDIEIKTCWWNHSLTEIFGALESNGLKLKLFQEFDYSPYKLRGMIEKEKGKFVLENRKNQKLPYVFNLKAIKK